MKSPRGNTETACLTCSRRFLTFTAEIKRGNGKYCSRKCYQATMSKEPGRNRKTGTTRHRGYILEWHPEHPAQVKGYVPQHRLIVERKLGRLLSTDEVVHHMNHVRDDNRYENLQVMTPSEHTNLHKMKVSPSVFFRGERIMYRDAIKILGIDRSSFFDMRKRNGLNHQQTFDLYCKKLGVK